MGLRPLKTRPHGGKHRAPRVAAPDLRSLPDGHRRYKTLRTDRVVPHEFLSCFGKDESKAKRLDPVVSDTDLHTARDEDRRACRDLRFALICKMSFSL